jgi:hypothetical protein
MTRVLYCSREDVKHATETAETARNNTQIDRAIAAASESIDNLTRRRFYPQIATRYFDWPDTQNATTWRLWLNQHELISITTLTAGGETIAASDYFLYPTDGPPYTRLEIDLSSTASFGGGDTHQRDVAITGVFGYSADEAAAGALAEALDASETAVDITDSALIGIGQLIKVDSERMQVTGKSMLTTGQTLQTAMTADDANVTCVVSNGAAFAAGETILLDAERMLIEDIAGNSLIVKRAFDGSVLAAHTGSTIYAPRTLTVERGVLGTTAATHTTSTAITKHVVPSLVRDLCIAEALNTVQQESTGYARQIGKGESARELYARGLRDLRQQVYEGFARRNRIRAV